MIKENPTHYSIDKGGDNNPFYRIPKNKIHSIDISLLNEEYELTTHEENDIIIKGPSINQKDYELIFEESTFRFKRNDHHTISRQPYGDGKEMTILLPKDILLRSFQFTIKSGEGRLSNIDADQVSLSNISGDMSVSNIQSSDFSLKTESGDARVDYLTSSNATFSTTTADIEISHINIKNFLTCSTLEGDIDIEEGFTQELFFNTESGDFGGKEFYPNTISFDSISGDLKIKNKKTTHDIIIKSKESIDGEIKLK